MRDKKNTGKKYKERSMVKNIEFKNIFFRKVFFFFVNMPTTSFMTESIKKSNNLLSQCHTHDFLKCLYENNLAVFKRNGRIKEYTLTSKGINLQKLMHELKGEIDKI